MGTEAESGNVTSEHIINSSFELLDSNSSNQTFENEDIEINSNDISMVSINLKTSPQKSQEPDFDFGILKNKIEKNYKQISISRKMRKYYRKRYQLFSLFDQGILLDNESWFSVTPEKVAQHIAAKTFEKMGSRSNLTILDAFCGSGGNTIAFAQLFENVISCDIDFTKLQCAQYNASQVYKVGHKINFLMQDFFSLHETLKEDQQIDVIFLSPPWGGTNYLQMKQADISEFPLDGFHIYLYCLNKLKCKNIVYFLPRNCNIDQILYMAGPGGVCEIEQNFLGYKLVALSAYYGYELNNQVEEQDLQE